MKTYIVPAAVRRVGAIGRFYGQSFAIRTEETDLETIRELTREQCGAEFEFNWIGKPQLTCDDSAAIEPAPERP